MKRARFHIAKMDCPTEERLIRKRLEPMTGVKSLEFNLMQRELTVQHELDDDGSLEAALGELGMEPRRLDAEPAAGGAAGARAAVPPAPDTSSRLALVVLGVSGAAALTAEVVAWTSGDESSQLVIGLSVASIAAGGRETLKKGLLALRHRTMNINLLMMIAIAGAMIIGQWPEAAMVTFLFALAERIEAYSLDRARNAIRGLMELTPDMATVQQGEAWVAVEASSVEPGQVVRVRPGERIPLDGKVRSGRSTVNQAPITGESIPVRKEPGDPVFAGTVNELGAIDVEVTAKQGDTVLARILRTVQQAQADRAPTQRFVDRFSHYYTPIVVVLAILIAAGPPLVLGAPLQPWLYKALVMLVIACPCALVISTPVTVVSGLAAAARQGILVKGGAYLERGRELRVVALDKTGTVTHGKPEVTDIVPFGGRSADDVLALAASVDALSDHPVARAVVAKWTGPLSPVTDFDTLVGRGVVAKINGRPHYVGSHRLAEERGVCSSALEAELTRLEAQGKTAILVATDEGPLGVLGVADAARETGVEAIRRMHALGLVTVMLTGDNQKTGEAIAKAVGIDDVRGGLMPEDKLAAIDALAKQHGAVGMVGDGINDAPALAKASIGFAMGAAGTDTALETADVALMDDDLRRLPAFVELSRRTARVLTQNIVVALAIKAIFFGLALFGAATLWMAVFADMGASLIVVFNGLRLLRAPAAGAAPSPPAGTAAPEEPGVIHAS